MAELNKKRIAVFGSTGSIGTQALEVIDNYPDLFEVEILTAQTNDKLLIEQALKFKPKRLRQLPILLQGTMKMTD